MRRRLEGVAEVFISQSQQTAMLTFVPGTVAFSAAAFRSAIAEADVEVLRVDMEVCGVISEGHLHWRGASATPVVVIRGAPPRNGPGCVTGRLNEHAVPYELLVTDVAHGSE